MDAPTIALLAEKITVLEQELMAVKLALASVAAATHDVIPTASLKPMPTPEIAEMVFSFSAFTDWDSPDMDIYDELYTLNDVKQENVK